ncbi:MAG TPA: tRNA glutamyl-Q(34) synthetase GluQRS [Tepidisphaeraceae bacterium]|jgi:glutamyl-tRNA synthetase|nr:tRNA glutamyl-Q(34) synthetase GluQRS [Tepidisphaeraceae bacterium]
MRFVGITRLAPSPTGALHLGNARTFLVNWWMARQAGWRIVLRVEDIDGPRIKEGADELAMEDLRWLGIDWDEGPVYQTQRTERYGEAIERLIEGGYSYFCRCTRKDIELAASAPNAGDGSAVYPGTCRDEKHGTGAVRFRVGEEIVEFEDGFAGRQRFNVAKELGDFVIRKSDGTAAYQLAVVVDDVEMGVTEVVRGDDLLDSTPRQMLLYRALGWGEKVPRYWHLPLVVGVDGRRLAKRHGDTRLASYREAGVPASRVLELLARWCGMEVQGRVGCAGDLLRQFELGRMSREKIVFTADDEAYLRMR